MTATACRPRHPIIRSSYLRKCFEMDSLRRIIISTIKALRPLAYEFDTIAFRGASGSLIAPAVAACLRKHLLLVRKDENCHSYDTVEGNIATERYAIIDDFVSSGRTVGHCIDAIRTMQEAEKMRQEACGANHELYPIGKPVLLALYLECSHSPGRPYGSYGDFVRTVGCRPDNL